MSELEKAIGNAWSLRDEEEPDEYLGAVDTEYGRHYYYRIGNEYRFETDYDRMMKKKLKEKRQQEIRERSRKKRKKRYRNV